MFFFLVRYVLLQSLVTAETVTSPFTHRVKAAEKMTMTREEAPSPVTESKLVPTVPRQT